MIVIIVITEPNHHPQFSIHTLHTLFVSKVSINFIIFGSPQKIRIFNTNRILCKNYVFLDTIYFFFFNLSFKYSFIFVFKTVWFSQKSYHIRYWHINFNVSVLYKLSKIVNYSGCGCDLVACSLKNM